MQIKRSFSLFCIFLLLLLSFTLEKFKNLVYCVNEDSFESKNKTLKLNMIGDKDKNAIIKYSTVQKEKTSVQFNSTALDVSNRWLLLLYLNAMLKKKMNSKQKRFVC